MRVCTALLVAITGCATAGPDDRPAPPTGTLPDAGSTTTPDAAGRVDHGACSFSGVLATWTLSSEPGSQSSTDTSSTAPGITAAPLARAPSLTAMAGAGSINAANWSTAVEDPTRYYTLAITA